MPTPLSLRAKPHASTAHGLQVARRAAQITSRSNNETQTIGFAKMIVKAGLFDGFAGSSEVGTALIHVVLSAFSTKTLISPAVNCRKIGLTAELTEGFP